MTFYSTRNREHRVDFQEAVFRGLAPDGGLYHPVDEPDLKALMLQEDPFRTFPELAADLTSNLLPNTFSPETAARICTRAFSFAPELRKLSDSIYVLELFHGPSCAFKDFGASFLASAMEELLGDRRAVILTATSGDTGSAVAQAFVGRKGIDVVILYPSGRVSPLQEKQLTTVGGNVVALEIDGSFDDCQRMVKEAFTDADLARDAHLTSANSINLGRLLPQSFYYISAFVQLRSQLASEIVFSVPSGNFGNLTAGILAWRWGLPVSGFIAATNANDVVPEYLDSGIYTPRPSIKTVANAMDVGNPSNFERMVEIFGSDYQDMRAMVGGEVITDDEISDCIGRYHKKTGVFLDPHTATGVHAAERYLEGDGAGDATVITLGTAHPAKFGDIVKAATGEEPPLPDRLAAALAKEKHSIAMAPRIDELRTFLLERFAS